MDVKAEAKKLEGWELEGEKLIKKFKFERFLDGIEFVNMLAQQAEKEQHHPGIRINYTTVTVVWTTFSTNELKERDIEGAKATDKIFG
jgi:4a-hydroxytetrahydrobiopterin dehydratase